MALEKTFTKGERLLASDLNSIVSEVNKNANMVNIGYRTLLLARSQSKLIPGRTYRITDYTCTTSQAGTQSAGHVFDILVTADDVDKLNENARAIQHSGDTYFTGSDLSAWELKYSLDNDPDRFSWAVTGLTGRGVIYYMKDEWNNECPYDFKNIQFARYQITACPKVPSLVGQYSVSGINGITVNTGNPFYCYTFTVQEFATSTNGGMYDVSVYQNKYTDQNEEHNKTHNNIIKEYYINNNVYYQTRLPNNVFVTFNNGTINFELNPYFNNTLGNNCYNNTFGNGCYNNTFGNTCTNNTFGNSYSNNTFGNSCYSNAFGNSCYSNAFGNSCYYNAFGNNVTNNTFGNNVTNNTIKNYYQYNTFGNNVTNNTFNNDYVRWCTFFNAVKYLNVSVTSSSTAFLQNLQILNGCQGTSSSILTITSTQVTSNRPFTTLIGKNTNNSLTVKPAIS